MPKLKNKRHEAFCMEYRRNGFNGLQAYKSVYKCSDKVAHKSGSRLLANVGIKARLEELGKKDSLRYGIDMNEIVYDLKELAKNSEDNNRLKAIDTLIKIAGEYAPTKTDNNNKDEITFKDTIEIDLD